MLDLGELRMYFLLQIVTLGAMAMNENWRTHDVISRLFNQPLGKIPAPLPEKMSIVFFAVSGIITGIYWLVFSCFIPEEVGKYDNPMWFIFGAVLPLVCMWFELIYRNVAWVALIGGYLALGWFGLDDQTAFAQSMKIVFLLYLFLGIVFGVLRGLLNKYCSSDIPEYCRKLRRRIEKNNPPPEGVENCTNILSDLWNEVRSMPESREQKDLLRHLLKLIDKVEYYEYNDIDSFFNEPELRRFKWWNKDELEQKADGVKEVK